MLFLKGLHVYRMECMFQYDYLCFMASQYLWSRHWHNVNKNLFNFYCWLVFV